MKTVEEQEKDMDLDGELHELYLLSKHWTSDISFAEDEIRFLKHMFEKHLVQTLSNEQLIKAVAVKKSLAELDVEIPALKASVISLLKFIDPLINESNKEIGVDLIENFFSLEKEIKALFVAVKEVKKSMFNLIEVELKQDRPDVAF